MPDPRVELAWQVVGIDGVSVDEIKDPETERYNDQMEKELRSKKFRSVGMGALVWFVA
jgi:hypothetical protein